MAFDRCPSSPPAALDAEPEADQAPSVIALIAGTLALSTRFAQLDPQDAGDAALRRLIAAKAAANLDRIAAHDEAPACFRALTHKLAAQWQALREAPEPGAIETAFPSPACSTLH